MTDDQFLELKQMVLRTQAALLKLEERVAALEEAEPPQRKPGDFVGE